MRANILGDLRAEHDHKMLDIAFYDSPDYRTLIEGSAKRIVVGRRGTGKSALFYKLSQHWKSDTKTRIINFAPEASEIIGVRHYIKILGENENLIRAGSKIIWRYALMLESVSQIVSNFRYRGYPTFPFIESLSKEWQNGGENVATRLRHALSTRLISHQPPELVVGELSKILELSRIESALKEALEASNLKIQILIDKLDEGYEPDNHGVALLSGLIYATNHINSTFENQISCLCFFRDNVFRAIERHDPDYSREIEGQVLRLHWDEYHLFKMLTKRLRIALSITEEKDQKVWDHCTDRNIEGKDGFRKCLRLTLYRPRDLLLLLNEAFNQAGREGRECIVDPDIDSAAKSMSEARRYDLFKEYKDLIPGLEVYINAFSNGKARLKFSEISEILDKAMKNRSLPDKILQHMEILGSPSEAIRTLYSIGFLGTKEQQTQSYIFCHDGRRPDLELNSESNILIHPCYWIALNLDNGELGQSESEEIHDDYDIAVTSETPEIRKHKLGQFIEELPKIPIGREGASEFEEWCLKAVKILFPASLGNAELHPNRDATQRRDIVARNDCSMPSWKRIYEDYHSRQVIFEVKNFSTDLGPDEYRQMLSYLTGEYGNLGFIINRSDSSNICNGSELDWVRTMYYEHKRLVIKLAVKDILAWLSKLRSPQKHDAPDVALNGLIDRYARNYLQLGSTPQKTQNTKK